MGLSAVPELLSMALLCAAVFFATPSTALHQELVAANSIHRLDHFEVQPPPPKVKPQPKQPLQVQPPPPKVKAQPKQPVQVQPPLSKGKPGPKQGEANVSTETSMSTRFRDSLRNFSDPRGLSYTEIGLGFLMMLAIMCCFIGALQDFSTDDEYDVVDMGRRLSASSLGLGASEGHIVDKNPRGSFRKAQCDLYLAMAKEGGFNDVLGWISIDKDGGLEKIPRIEIDVARKTTCVLRFLGVLLNTFLILYFDLSILSGSMYYLFRYHGISGNDLPTDIKNYLDLTSKSRLLNMPEVALIALLEFIGILYMLGYMFLRLMFILRSYYIPHEMKNVYRFDRYDNMWHMFDALRLVGIFSILQLFSLCHPSLVARKFNAHVAGDEVGSYAYVLRSLHFGVTRLVAFFLSTMAFGVKLALVSIQFYEDDAHPTFVPDSCAFAWRWAMILQLFIQTFSILDIEETMRWRLFTIVSGGQDTMPDVKECLLMHVYRARITHDLHHHLWKTGRRFDFIAVMTTFNDIDLQLLMFEEDQEKKDRWTSREKDLIDSEAALRSFTKLEKEQRLRHSSTSFF